MERSYSRDNARLLKLKVCKAAQLGNCEEIVETLRGLSSGLIREALCSFSDPHTPLTIAAQNGHKNVVQLLLTDFRLYYDEKLNQINGNRGHRWQALCAAMACGQMEIVKWLLDTETDAELLYESDYSVLHIACRDNRLSVVQYLVEKGAKTNFVYFPGKTCLHLACLASNIKMVRLLLEHGADPNQKSGENQTALHYAAHHNLPEIVAVLMDYGAQMLPNKHGHTPMIESVVRRSEECFYLFLGSDAVTRQDKINGLELQAAVAAPENMELAYKLLLHAMKGRYADPSDVLSKPQRPPVPALGNIVESRDQWELASRRTDYAALRMECLVIPERILGSGNDYTWQFFLKFCIAAAKEGRYIEASSVWIYAKRSCQSNNLKLTFYNIIADILQEALQGNSPLPFENIEQILVLSVEEMERKAESEEVDDLSACIEEHNITQNVVFLIHALRTGSEQEVSRLTPVVRRLFRVQHLLKVTPVLHIAVSLCQSTNLQIELRPSLPRLVEFLLQCGARVDALDSEGQTALHAIARCQSHEDGRQVICSILQALIDGKAHADIQDCDGQTPLEAAATDEARCVLRNCYPLSLKCIAISVVLENRIPHSDGLPEDVKEDIERHKPVMRKKSCVWGC